MKVAVIGANGFLGRYIVDECLNEGWVVDCIYHNNKDKIPQDFISYNISELNKINYKYDIIFIVAGNFESKIGGLIESNILLPLRCIRNFPNSKIVFISSVTVYGIQQNVINEEASFINPNLYGFSKLCGEFIMRDFGVGVYLRLTALYGQGMNCKLFIPKIIHNAKYNQKIILYGEGTRLQDYLHVRDAAKLSIKVALKGVNSKTYLGVYGKSFSNFEVAKKVQTFFPDCRIEFSGKDNTPSFVYNNEWTKKQLQFQPQYCLEEGIKELINHA